MTDSDRIEILLTGVLEQTRKLRADLRRLEEGDLVARLSAAERQAIAREVLDRLDERFARERQAAAESPPRPAAKPAGRGLRRHLR